MRESVKWFAGIMEQILQKHDDKKGSDGWLGADILWLFACLNQEIEELNEKVPGYNYDKSESLIIIKECADIANYAMMIADRMREGKK